MVPQWPQRVLDQRKTSVEITTRIKELHNSYGVEDIRPNQLNINIERFQKLIWEFHN